MSTVSLPKTSGAAASPAPSDGLAGSTVHSEAGSAAGRLARSPKVVPLWWRDLSAAVAWATILFVVGLWIAGGGLTAFGTFGEAMTNLGRLSGLVASDLLLLQVLLIARVPFVEQAWGQDELLRLHRLVGFTSFNLMLVHIVLTVIGYESATGLGFIGEFVDQVLHSPGMLLALAGSIALVMVAVTSVRRARARLRYESWHLLHLYAYLGAGLALPHQLWAGADFLSSPVATVFWWGLYAVSITAVVAFRIVVPLWRSWRHRLVVSEVVAESPTVTSVAMTGRALDRLPARAGQFLTWRFLDGPGWSRAHPYSLSAAPDGRTLRITAEAVGDGSSRLRALRPGTKVMIEGPYGRLHRGVKTRRRTVLIAAGIGIAPMRALLEDLPEGRDDTILIYRVGTQDDILLAGELLELAQRRGARAVSVVGHRNPSRSSWLPAEWDELGDARALTSIVPDIAQRDVFVCGSPRWMDAVIDAARAAGVPDEAIHHERFSW